MDLEFADRTWGFSKVRALVFGRTIPDSDSGDGWCDVECSSWYQIRHRAYDRGDVDLVCDVLQFEQAVELIPDRKVRAAVILAMMGWDLPDIGAAIGGRRTGSQLVRSGVRSIVRAEERRSELR